MVAWEQAQDSLARLREAWRGPVAAAEVPVDETAFEDPHLNALSAAAQALDFDGRRRLLDDLGGAIGEIHPYHASRIGVLAGLLADGVIANGGDPGPPLDVMLGRMAEVAPAAVRYFEAAEDAGRGELADAMPDELDPAIDPEGYLAVAATRFFAIGLVSPLAASPAARIGARSRQDLVMSLWELDQRCLAGAPAQVGLLLAMSDGETVIVVCPATRRGARFATTGVQCVAHLYTLVDLVLRENRVDLLAGRLSLFSSPKLDDAGRRVLAAARGDAEAFAALDRDETFAGTIALRPWGDIEADGSFTPMPFVGVDAPVRALSQLDGAIVLGAADPAKAGPRRTWDVGFFEPLHPKLRSDLAFEGVLSRDEVDRWLARIRER